MSDSGHPLNGKDPNYWKSLKELNNSSESFELKANEFMKGVTDDFELSKLPVISRRKFLALLSASAAFAAASCSDYRDKGEIIPYNKKPEEILPGIADYYASTCNGCTQSCGILVKTREGRPIKVDGNPDHPVNKGKICSIGQASILNLYDPVRLKTPLKMVGGAGKEITWQTADDEIVSALDDSDKNGKEIAVITHSVLSPTEKKVLDEFSDKYPAVKIYSYELIDNAYRNKAWQLSYGEGKFPLIKWESAKIILAIEADFIGNEGYTVENIRKFTEKRDVMKSKEFNRLYMVEGAMSQTGINSDYRIRLHPDKHFEFVMCLINEIQKRTGRSLIQAANYDLKGFIKTNLLSNDIIYYLISDLIKNRGAAIVYAGDQLPVNVHLAVNALNEILGNTLLYNSEQEQIEFSELSLPEDISLLVRNMKEGKVGVVIHYDTNPVFHFSPAYGYKVALQKVPFSVTLTESENETSVISNYVLPINHYLECWGDFNIRTGIFSLQQPVISSLCNSRQKEAVILYWNSGLNKAYTENIYHQYLMNNWEKNIYPGLNIPVDFKAFWYTALEAGIVLNHQTIKRNFSFNRQSLANISPTPVQEGLTLFLKKNYFIGDGRYTGNGWLQELSHPVTKIVWDNYAALSPSFAKQFKLEENDVIELDVEGRKAQLPVFIQPGMADNLIAADLGYGRINAGVIGSNVGVNVICLMGTNVTGSKFIYDGIKISGTDNSYKLVTTQEQHSMDDSAIKDQFIKRGIIREGTLSEYKKDPAFLFEEKGHPLSINNPVEYNGVKWGMSVDMNKCIGCNQCIAACNVENNIPVVGKDQVDRGRRMHWIRVDRYYSGTADEPNTSLQLMLCQQCDDAPCENVCPTSATNHSPDGLNQMIYNRCVGTRYCSNNCPYKVRRFNFLDFRFNLADSYYRQKSFDLVNNPEVTVRSRGVMEKCTFCIQRIMLARQQAINEGRPLKGSDVKTACQVACPSEAIIFGDLNDSESEVSRYRDHELGYKVLKELNTRPNVTYIAKLKNTRTEGES